MRTNLLKAAAAAAVLSVLSPLLSPAQAPASGGGPAPDKPRVFLDWPGADVVFFKSELPFAELVPGLDQAQVQVRVTPPGQPGAGPLTVEFAGLKEFQGENNSLVYSPAPGEGPEAVRAGLAGLLKLGLLRYVAKTPAGRHVSVRFLDQVKPTSVVDKWDFWVFNLSANAFLMGESQYGSSSYRGSVSANRVTPALKVRTSVYGNYRRTRFEFPDEVYRSSSHGYGFSGLVVKSLSEHWSAGAFVSAQSSTYSNLDLSVTAAPALEYNVFPYSQSTQRQFRVLYRVGGASVRYREETVYFKTRETLLQESLSLTYEAKRPWGSVTLEAAGSHYFHDFGKNRLEVGGDVEVRIWKGLSFEFSGSYSRIRDQLALPAGGASYEEILLRQKQLATGYDYHLSVGLNFTFGSTRSTVVNPRFGNGGGGISIRM